MKKILILCVLITFILSGCGNYYSPDAEKPNVVVTIFPEYDFVRAVGGDLINIKLLIDPGTEVHAFDPAPSDIVSIEKSDLFVMIGGESDEWAKRLVSAGDDINVLSMMDYVSLLTEDGEDEFDEHIWISPTNAISMVNTICDELSKLDIKNSGAYRKNADNYISGIEKVRSEIQETVEKSESKFIMVADRFPFKYFANEFGINYAAAFGGCATSTDISLKTMSRLVDEIKENRCNSAFYTEMSNKNIANALSQETGIALYELHSAHNVTLDDFKNGITYIDIMRNNASALEKGMV